MNTGLGSVVGRGEPAATWTILTFENLAVPADPRPAKTGALLSFPHSPSPTALRAHLSATGTRARGINAVEGFRDDLDMQCHRGADRGWKTRGLASRQA